MPVLFTLEIEKLTLFSKLDSYFESNKGTDKDLENIKKILEKAREKKIPWVYDLGFIRAIRNNIPSMVNVFSIYNQKGLNETYTFFPGVYCSFSNIDKINTPLGFCACWGRVEIARLLIEQSSDVNALSLYGNSALHEVLTGIGDNLHTDNPQVKVAELLLQNGADVNKKNDSRKRMQLEKYFDYCQTVHKKNLSMISDTKRKILEIFKRNHISKTDQGQQQEKKEWIEKIGVIQQTKNVDNLELSKQSIDDLRIVFVKEFNSLSSEDRACFVKNLSPKDLRILDVPIVEIILHQMDVAPFDAPLDKKDKFFSDYAEAILGNKDADEHRKSLENSYESILSFEEFINTFPSKETSKMSLKMEGKSPLEEANERHSQTCCCCCFCCCRPRESEEVRLMLHRYNLLSLKDKKLVLADPEDQAIIKAKIN